MSVTLKDIAKEAGVSVMAVSAVMNRTSSTRVSEKKRQKIAQIANELGYRSNLLARTLRGGRSSVIGVMIDSQAPPSMYNIVRYIESEAAANGYRIMISEQHDSVDSMVESYQSFEQYGVEGVICLAYGYPGQEEKFQSFFGGRKNLVLVSSRDNSELPQVYVDLGEAYRQAFRHFIDTGRRKIGAIICDLPCWSQQTRISLYRNVCNELRLPQFHYSPADYSDAEHIIPEIEKCIIEFIIPQKIDAVMIHSDMYGAYLLSALTRHGIKVPDDIAVIGDDDREFCPALLPPLASINFREEVQGMVAIQMMLKMLRKEEFEPRQLVPAKLVLRESAGYKIQ